MSEANKPNVLILFTDQQRADTIAALGNPVIKTPNFDRLVREGTAFTSCYSPAPECVPARCSLTFGQYPQTTHCYGNGSKYPSEDGVTMFSTLRDAGYRTHGIGKCHFAPRNGMFGFETREQQEELRGDIENDDYMQYLRSQGFEHVGDPHGVRGEMYYIPQPAQMPARHHPTQWIGDRSTDFIKSQGDSDQPWCLFSSFIHPHPPFAPPAPWHKLYRAPRMPLPHLPPDFEALHCWVNRHQNRYKYRDQGFDKNLMRNIIAYYYGCISFIDYQIGRMLDALEETGQLDNTLILASADHGELLGDFGSYGKRSFHDAASKVPMLARLPGRFEAGARVDTPVSLIDLSAAAVAAGTGHVPESFEGVDLADIASGASDRDTIYGQLNQAGRAIYTAVTPQWKYVYSAGDQREYLLDRRHDPRETRDCVGSPFCGGPLQTMREKTITFLREHGETAALNDEGDAFRIYEKHQLPANPDAGLLIQDQPWENQTIPGYTDA